VTPALERRVEAQRRRVLVRAWEYRQRHHARGVWFRLRRLLADASAAFVIPGEEADVLLAEGFQAEPVGGELEPPKTLLVVPAERVALIPSARRVPLRLGPELFEARHLALTPFPRPTPR